MFKYHTDNITVNIIMQRQWDPFETNTPLHPLSLDGFNNIANWAWSLSIKHIFCCLQELFLRYCMSVSIHFIVPEGIFAMPTCIMRGLSACCLLQCRSHQGKYCIIIDNSGKRPLLCLLRKSVFHHGICYKS